MVYTYFKRYRMMIDTAELDPLEDAAASDVTMLMWRDDLVRAHARVKFEAFRHEIDATVFPCLGQADGCSKLMYDIRRRDNFVPEATYLAAIRSTTTAIPIPVGTIQGLRPNAIEGAIQNIGILPQYRGRGIGQLLLLHSLHGFAAAGCQQVSLEVTTQNAAAIRMYERFGFRRTETVYKLADVPYA